MRRLLAITTLPLFASLAACVGVIDGGPLDEPTDDPSPDDVPSTPAPSRALPAGKIAVVLAHGLGGNADSFDPSIVAAIEADGHVVQRTQVPGVDSVAVRAAALAPQIDALLAATGAAKVHVIAHSMGGLDTRYLISKLGYASKVASLTTISTPHRGSPLADLALGLTSSGQGTQQEALDAILEVVGQVDPAALDRALVDLSVAQAPSFNAAVPDAAGVRYFSYAGLSTPGGVSNPNAPTACNGAAPDPASTQALLLLAQPIVANGTDRVPNDAVVSIPSATWGSFAGCVAADHLSEIGAATETHDAPAFFRGVVGKLAQL